MIANWVGYSLTSIILIMHLFAWWLPYFFGFPLAVKADYEKYFSRTYKILPPIKDHIIPDVEHIGVGVLLLTTLLIQSWYMF
ncbi:hypothetical protein V7161_12875 [Neobacillus drentensis]|uniref:hypothetical protein n=1 Tax=Neobacillus drentensis TaxID=220684 RepID=UPI002FFEA08C